VESTTTTKRSARRAALDQAEGGIHLISAVNGEINAIDGIQALERDAQFGGQHLALKGGGDTHDVVEFTAAELLAQGLDHQGGGGTGTEAHHHAVTDLLHSGLRHRLLHPVLQIRHRVLRMGEARDRSKGHGPQLSRALAQPGVGRAAGRIESWSSRWPRSTRRASG
jgi:hypothetical protein